MLTLIDAHVHVHPEADVSQLLDAALLNFGTEAAARRESEWHGVLLLTEMKDAAWFEQAQADGGLTAGRWTIRPHASDPLALTASVGESRILVVAGRQVVTAEGIEVLTLATRAVVQDGLSLAGTLVAARNADALVVLPWAVGKWIGRRGQLVAAALAENRSGAFAGDNGGRPVFWPRPAVFSVQAARDRPVLSGSDPLPLRGDERRVGSFGVAVRTALDVEAPAQRLRELLRSAPAADVSPFGALQGPSTFFRNQIGLRRARPAVRPPAALQSAGGLERPDIETSSADYARRFSGPAGRYLLQVQSEAVRLALVDLPPGRALDVGGGHGQLVGVLRDLGWDVTVHGTDLTCERNLRELHGESTVPFLKGDLFQLPVADHSYDLVIAVRLISHVDAWPRLVAEMSRVARRAVVIDYPSTGGLNALTPLLFGVKKKLEGNTRTYTSFSRAALEAAFGRHGFRFKRELKQFLLPMVIHRVGHATLPLRLAERLFKMVGLTPLLGSPAILRLDRR